MCTFVCDHAYPDELRGLYVKNVFRVYALEVSGLHKVRANETAWVIRKPIEDNGRFWRPGGPCVTPR